MAEKIRMKTPEELLKELNRTTYSAERDFLRIEVLCHIAMSLDKLVTIMCTPTYKIEEQKIDIESLKTKAEEIFKKEEKNA